MLLENKTIFVVEDDPMNRAVMLTILQMNGATAHFDPWGSQTLDRIRKLGNIDLILMDLMLPRGNTGYKVFELLQAEDDLKNIPVVIVSASDPALEMRKAKAMGFMGFISKPINNRIFPNLITSVLNGQEVWAEDFLYE